jgi:hypothetical protein
MKMIDMHESQEPAEPRVRQDAHALSRNSGTNPEDGGRVLPSSPFFFARPSSPFEKTWTAFLSIN